MKKVFFLLVLVVAISAGWYFIRPLFGEQVVDEELPFDLSELEQPATQPDSTEPESMTLEAFDAMMVIPSEEEIAGMTEAEKEKAEMAMLDMASKMDVVVEETMEEHDEDQTGPVLLSSGNFRDADSFHQGSGLAKLIKLEDGSHLVRLEDFEVTNGPDLFVYLVENGNPTSSADVKAGFTNIGRLKGNKGNQNYVVPADVDVSKYNSIVIYCRAFSVLFSPAPLS